MVQSIQSEDAARIDFGLIFFSSNEVASDQNKYQLVIESTKFADQHGFSSVWIPERHFTKDGWLYPNPAVLQAALARETRSIHLRAGSVVLPLHNPLRVAEEWAMVDNLSNGRVGISVASGWHPHDFAFFPENYERRREAMYEGIETVRRLWRGESIQVRAGDGRMIDVRTYPTPVQAELPIWVTAAGNPKTFEAAGETGAHLLTHMYNQDTQELAEKIRIYRQARADHGYNPATGQVSVMLHTFLHKDDATVLSQVQGPFCNYLRSASYLVNAVAYSRGQQVDFSTLSEQDQEDYLHFVLDRLISTRRVLFGTPENCADFVLQLYAAGVDEIACQFDFGVETDLVLESLPYLDQLKNLVNQKLSSQTAYEARKPFISGSLPSPASLADQVPQPVVVDENALSRIRERCGDSVSIPEFYRTLSLHGVELAARFQGIEELYKGTHEALGLIQLHSSLLNEAERYHIHPTLLDACFQVLIAALPQNLIAREDALYLPTGIRRFQVFAPLQSRVWSHARLSYSPSSSPAVMEGDVRILDRQGNLVAQATGLKLQRAELSGPGTSRLDEWLYELAWEPVALSRPAMAEHTPAAWIIFRDARSVGLSLAALLEAQGDDYVLVEPSDRYQRVNDRHYRLRPASSDDLQLLLEDVSQHARYPLSGLIDLWSIRTTPVSATSAATLRADQELSGQHALALIQADLRLVGVRDLPRVWLVTRGAQPVLSSQEALEIVQAPVWGLGKTCAMEHPDAWGGLIDLEGQESEDVQARQLFQSIASGQSENLLAFRQQTSYAARMVHRVLDPTIASYVPDPAASYLVTGGLWGLGLEVARWLADQGARHLVLLGRTALPPREEWDHYVSDGAFALRLAGIRAIERAGASVHYASVDVTNEQQLRDFLTLYEQDGHPPIRGVVHAASVWQDAHGGSLVGPLVNLSMDAYATVFEPKVVGLWHLHQFLRERPLDFFVTFSSAASLFGSAAQGNYAAAGEFLDVFAHYQRAQGIPALSIDWGAISQIGFGATPEGLRVHEYWESHGIQRISPQDVLHALAVLLRQPLARVGLVKLNWTQLYQFYPQLVASPLFSRLAEIAQETQQSVKSSGPSAGSEVMQLLAAALTDGQRQQVLEDYLRAQVAMVLRSTPDQLDIHQPLTALGLDSLMAIELKNRLELELEVRIPIVTFLQGPTIAEFATQVRSQFLQPVSGDAQVARPGYPGFSSVLSGQEPQQVLAGQSLLQGESHAYIALAPLSPSDLDQQIEEVGKTSHDLSAQDATELLSHIDQLSDEEVERLLSQLVRNED